MLCRECEQIFSEWETKFASHIFYPHVRNQRDEFEYEDWLHRFVLSVSWRLLVSEMAVWDEFERSKADVVEERVETWRKILIGEKPLAEDPSTHHISFFDKIDLIKSDPSGPDNLEIYLTEEFRRNKHYW
ncbi:hypothetical protein [Haloferax sp. ATB1]|uniref:hypothetical protein n=1 Tax=Haloferax sp. ATB1 TaxID=1508454 RepID=UPI000FE1444E|nr:hypothetical protein [Haloferax sp. ATB1]